MKLSILSFILIFFAINDCSNEGQEEIKSVSYKTYTRGSSSTYTITSEEIKVISTGVEAKENSEVITKEQWEMITSEIKKIDTSKLEGLEAPTESRASDAAAHAELSLIIGNSAFNSSTFDHGNSPEALKPLVQAILRLAENVE
ncbi:hypothetical protein [uncultured Christiangramia sp.]|uniref:hypothetical protein n=1 Tax=uncultured Christiangramia sp. TaxID=503836 RepID=UPI00261646B1|nr:hypothetical protein [uncultured Christiangramia sp.]